MACALHPTTDWEKSGSWSIRLTLLAHPLIHKGHLAWAKPLDAKQKLTVRLERRWKLKVWDRTFSAPTHWPSEKNSKCRCRRATLKTWQVELAKFPACPDFAWKRHRTGASSVNCPSFRSCKRIQDRACARFTKECRTTGKTTRKTVNGHVNDRCRAGELGQVRVNRNAEQDRLTRVISACECAKTGHRENHPWTEERQSFWNRVPLHHDEDSRHRAQVQRELQESYRTCWATRRKQTQETSWIQNQLPKITPKVLAAIRLTMSRRDAQERAAEVRQVGC